jgi:hypothetical protein
MKVWHALSARWWRWCHSAADCEKKFRVAIGLFALVGFVYTILAVALSLGWDMGADCSSQSGASERSPNGPWTARVSYSAYKASSSNGEGKFVEVLANDGDKTHHTLFEARVRDLPVESLQYVYPVALEWTSDLALTIHHFDDLQPLL